MQSRESFDKDAKGYDKSRLSYPDEVIDWIIDKTSVSPGETLLEIGPGTGQATLPLARRGYPIHCVELGQRLTEKREETRDVDELRREEIKQSGYFKNVDFLRHRWFPAEKREQYISGFFTQSSFLSLDAHTQKQLEADIRELLNGLDEVIETEFYTESIGRSPS